MTEANLYHQQFEPKLDFPKVEAPDLTYILCSTPRCGSHLLGHTLYQTGQLGWPLEYLHPQNLLVWQQRFNTNNIKDTFTKIQQYRTSPSRCFGCKLHYQHLQNLVTINQFNTLFPRKHCIFIYRRDILAQAISWAKAEMTGSWISSQPVLSEARYNRKQIEKKLRQISIENAQWQYIIAHYGWPILGIEYENFLANPSQVVTSIFEFLGLEQESQSTISEINLPSRQGNHDNTSWKLKYLAEVNRDPLNSYEKTALMGQDLDQLRTATLVNHLLSRIKRKFSNSRKSTKP